MHIHKLFDTQGKQTLHVLVLHLRILASIHFLKEERTSASWKFKAKPKRTKTRSQEYVSCHASQSVYDVSVVRTNKKKHLNI